MFNGVGLNHQAVVRSRWEHHQISMRHCPIARLRSLVPRKAMQVRVATMDPLGLLDSYVVTLVISRLYGGYTYSIL